MENNLILRTAISPFTNDTTLNRILDWIDLDNNFINLKGNDILTANTSGNTLVVTKFNGDTLNIDLSSILPPPIYEYWTSGSTGSYSIKTNNDSGLISTSDYSVAEGYNTQSTNFASHAEGNSTVALGSQSHAEGEFTIASGMTSHAEGNGTQSNGMASHAEGNGTQSNGMASHAEGAGSRSDGDFSHSEGNSVIASGYASHAEGAGTQATNYQSHAEGQNTIASGQQSHAEGGVTIASGQQSHAEGYVSMSSGNQSHAEGLNTLASGEQSHAEGYSSQATNYQSHAEGYNTLASGQQSHVQGYNTIAYGDNSHAEGSYTVSSGDSSHAEGFHTQANEVASHAEGQYTTASGVNSHAEGYGTTAIGEESHAEGNNNVANGANSHVEGVTNHANGANSHVGGAGNTSNGNNSFVHSDTSIINSGATDSVILGGNNNTVNSNVTNSIILGGHNITATDDDTIYGPNANFKNNLVVGGNLTILGSAITANTETVLIKDNILTLNYGEVSNVVSSGIAGIEIDRGSGNKYDFIFVESAQTFNVGITGNTQPVATREANPLTNGIAVWDSTNHRFNTSYNISATTISATTFYGDVSQLGGIAGSNFSRTVYIDSVSGTDDMSSGRGQSGKPYKTIDYVLARVDDNTIITNRVISGCTTTNANNTITGVSTTVNVEVGQYVTGVNIPYNTVVVSKTSSSITLSKNATGSGTVVITLWYNIEVNCQGSFSVSGSINRNGVTFNTTSFAKLSAISVIIVHYTDTNNYKIPCQTFKGNWDVLTTGTAQFIKYDFSSDIGVTDVDYNFFDEWDKYYSNIVGSTETTSSISYKVVSGSYTKVGIKYNSSISKNGLFFWVWNGYNSSLSIVQNYTYGYLGCLQASNIGLGYTFLNLSISKGLMESPSGVYVIDVNYSDGPNYHTYYCDTLNGDVRISANVAKFYGDVINATNIYFSGYFSHSGYNLFVSYGNLFANNIYLSNCTTYGDTSGTHYLSNRVDMYGQWSGSLNDSNAGTFVVNGINASYDSVVYVTNGGYMTIKGQYNSGSHSYMGGVSNGTLVLDCKLNLNEQGLSISGGKLILTSNFVSTGSVTIKSQTGGIIIHKGVINYNAGSFAIRKSGGILQIEGGKFISNNTSNPIYVDTNTTQAKEIRVFNAITNCDGVSYSILSGYTGGYTPIDIVGGDIFENSIYL